MNYRLSFGAIPRAWSGHSIAKRFFLALILSCIGFFNSPTSLFADGIRSTQEWTQASRGPLHNAAWSKDSPRPGMGFRGVVEENLAKGSVTLFPGFPPKVLAWGVSSTTSSMACIKAFNAKTGETIWVSPDLPAGVSISYGSTHLPVCDPDENAVYMGVGRNVYRFNADDGSIVWTSEDIGDIVNASCTLGGGLVFISNYGGMMPADKTLYALNAQTGAIVWSQKNGGQGGESVVYASPSMATTSAASTTSQEPVWMPMPFLIGDELETATVYCFIDKGMAAYRAATGELVWTSKAPLEGTAWSSRAGFSGGLMMDGMTGHLFASTYPWDGSNAELYCIDAMTGAVVWRVSSADVPLGSGTPLLTPEGCLVICGTGQWGDPSFVSIFDAVTGALKHNIPNLASGSTMWNVSPIYTAGLVYFTPGDTFGAERIGYYGLRPEEGIIIIHSDPNFVGTLAIDAAGTLYGITEEGSLYWHGRDELKEPEGPIFPPFQPVTDGKQYYQLSRVASQHFASKLEYYNGVHFVYWAEGNEEDNWSDFIYYRIFDPRSAIWTPQVSLDDDSINSTGVRVGGRHPSIGVTGPLEVTSSERSFFVTWQDRRHCINGMDNLEIYAARDNSDGYSTSDGFEPGMRVSDQDGNGYCPKFSPGYLATNPGIVWYDFYYGKQDGGSSGGLDQAEIVLQYSDYDFENRRYCFNTTNTASRYLLSDERSRGTSAWLPDVSEDGKVVTWASTASYSSAADLIVTVGDAIGDPLVLGEKCTNYWRPAHVVNHRSPDAYGHHFVIYGHSVNKSPERLRMIPVKYEGDNTMTQGDPIETPASFGEGLQLSPDAAADIISDVTDANMLHVVWVAVNGTSRRVNYASYNIKTNEWGNHQVLTGDGDWERPTIAVDTERNIYIAAECPTATDIWMTYAKLPEVEEISNHAREPWALYE